MDLFAKAYAFKIKLKQKVKKSKLPESKNKLTLKQLVGEFAHHDEYGAPENAKGRVGSRSSFRLRSSAYSGYSHSRQKESEFKKEEDNENLRNDGFKTLSTFRLKSKNQPLGHSIGIKTNYRSTNNLQFPDSARLSLRKLGHKNIDYLASKVKYSKGRIDTVEKLEHLLLKKSSPSSLTKKDNSRNFLDAFFYKTMESSKREIKEASLFQPFEIANFARASISMKNRISIDCSSSKKSKLLQFRLDTDESAKEARESESKSGSVLVSPLNRRKGSRSPTRTGSLFGTRKFKGFNSPHKNSEEKIVELEPDKYLLNADDEKIIKFVCPSLYNTLSKVVFVENNDNKQEFEKKRKEKKHQLICRSLALFLKRLKRLSLSPKEVIFILDQVVLNE